MSDPSPRFHVSERHDVRLIGKSAAMGIVESEVECAARADAKVLITGETGAGKEVVARLIHQRSARSSRPLVTMNCAGLPDSLVESELFGHVRGSFTGAYRDKTGLLELAHTGTIFLDEVAEMSMRMQVVLLRFLETGEIQRIGSERSHTRIDARLITATNKDLQEQVAAGSFREDLYYRLNVIRIVVPPLRERADDVPLLVDYYLDACSRRHGVANPPVDAAAMEALMRYRWPGNIRELKNVVERLALKAGGQTVTLDDLPEGLNHNEPPKAGVGATATERPKRSVAEELASRMLDNRESFWAVVYPVFMARDLTREDLRKIVQLGLETSNGNYRVLTRLFGMADEDYKRFLSFLRKHDCHLPYQRFRTARAGAEGAGRSAAAGE
jgi:transcriptional regulator with GAF, ATPase, and Fis domain